MIFPLRARHLPLLLATLAMACGGSQAPAHTEAATASSGSTPPSTPTSTPTPTPTPTSTPAEGASATPAATSATSATSPRVRPKKISCSHVLIQYMGAERAGSNVVRTREQARAAAEKVLERARAGEDFSRLAVDFSDEPGAAQRGGSLGRFGHGQMVRAFDDAAFSLEVGGVSDIVETSFGFHIIKRTE